MNEHVRNLMRARRSGGIPVPAGSGTTILSWNLLHKTGATTADIARLIRILQPDLLLMQEATAETDILPSLLGGFYARSPLPGRLHGVACWSPRPFAAAPVTLPLPSGAIVRRVCQLIALENFAVANVHLSHGQMLNRRQLRVIAHSLPGRAAVLGDFNLVGPVMLPHFSDVGPRAPTHRMGDVLPLRIDRCLVRGLSCEAAFRLPRVRSDHHPIFVRLRPV